MQRVVFMLVAQSATRVAEARQHNDNAGRERCAGSEIF
jgi:hypothetical protein